MTENDLVLKCYDNFARDKEYKKVLLEVPFLSRSIDMVLVQNDETIITIEFKLHDWKKALMQAKDHALGADKAYICLPMRKLSEKIEYSFKNSGIGLLFYDDRTNEILEAISPSVETSKWEMWRTSLFNAITACSG